VIVWDLRFESWIKLKNHEYPKIFKAFLGEDTDPKIKDPNRDLFRRNGINTPLLLYAMLYKPPSFEKRSAQPGEGENILQI
jgi:hypothetical protein